MKILMIKKAKKIKKKNDFENIRKTLENKNKELNKNLDEKKQELLIKISELTNLNL